MHLCGVRGSSPAPGIDFVRYGGHTSCVALSHDGHAPSLILDAGIGLERAGKLLSGAPFAGTLLLTHLHWDHVLGLPFFSGADREDARIQVLIPEQASGEPAEEVLGGVMRPPYFPVGPTQLRGDWSFGTVEPGVLQLEGFEILAREIPHKGGRTFGYRIGDGRSTMTYMPDHCPTVLGAGEDGLGAYHETALELAADTDLLIHDAQLLPAELPREACFGHSAADYAVELGRRAGARAVVLFHHRTDRTDEALDALGQRLASSSPTVFVATEGAVHDL